MLDRLFLLMYEAYYRVLPRRIRNGISRRGRTIYMTLRNLYYLLFPLRHTAYLMEGRERHSGETLRTIYMGERDTLKYFSRLIYGDEGPAVRALGKVFKWSVGGRSLSRGVEPDLSIVMTNRLFGGPLVRNGFFILPEWIGQSMDLDRPPRDIWKGLSPNSREFIRKTRARIEKNGFTHSISREEADFDFFYKDIYRPSAVERHKEVAEVLSDGYLRAVFARGGILFVGSAGDRIAGMLYMVDCDGVFHSVSWGVHGGDERHLASGAGHALYYFAILAAWEQGCKAFNFGGSRPFLSDGILKYKSKWGASMRDNPWLPSFVGIRIDHAGCPGVKGFVESNGFVTVDGAIPAGCIFLKGTEGLSEEGIDAVLRDSPMRGLGKLTLYHGAEVPDDVKARVRQRHEGLVGFVSFRGAGS